MTITLNALQKQRRDTASNWTSNNTVLLAGELGYESDTKKFKIGDGSTAWQSLDYIPIPDTNRLLTGNLTVGGNFTVNGTTTTIDTTTLTVEDKNIEIGKVSTPTDSTADGGGITLKGATDKTINWVDSTDSWTLSEHLDLANGKVFKINNTEILSATTLGSSVVSSSLTSVGTIASGTWNATAISGSKVTPDFGSQNIVTTGTLGLGATPSTGYQLQVTGQSGYDDIVRLTAVGTNIGPRINLTPTGTGVGRLNATSNSLQLQTGGNTALTIDTSQNVGIGTTIPAAQLEVKNTGNVKIYADSSGGYIQQDVSNLDKLHLISSGEIKYQSDPENDTSHTAHIFETDGSERMRIDSSGRLLIGTDTTRSPGSTTCQLQIEGTNAPTSSFCLTRNSADSAGAKFIINKSRGASVGSDTAVQSGDILGSIIFVANDGTDSDNTSAEIRAQVDGTPGSDDTPGRIVFRTTADGANNTTERVRIDSSGRVLIGTTIIGDLNADNLTINDSSNCGITIRSGSNSRGHIFFTDTTSEQYQGFVRYIHQNNEDSLGFGTSKLERMRLDNSGRLFLGATSVGSYPKKLNIQGESGAIIHLNNYDTTTYAANTSTAIEFNLNTGNTGNQTGSVEIRAFKENGTNGNNARGLSFYTAENGASPAERMRITSGGSVLVATTSTTVNSANFGIVLGSDGSGGMFKNADGTADVFRSGGTQGMFQVNGDGDAFNTNNSYGQLSDETLKQDIVDAASQWDDIKNLRVRKFRFKDNPTGVLQIGVVAQEIEKVSAGLVQEDNEGIKSVKYSVLYMKAVKCLQEAIAKIEVLETKVAALEAA